MGTKVGSGVGVSGNGVLVGGTNNVKVMVGVHVSVGTITGSGVMVGGGTSVKVGVATSTTAVGGGCVGKAVGVGLDASPAIRNNAKPKQ
ncbi:MAG TPA: hypothetical protein PKD55_24935 [Bellilinea sp.]|nr:hypothetical protein [Bellilinea sp.]